MFSKKIRGACLFCVTSFALANEGVSLQPIQQNRSMVDFQQTVQDVRDDRVIYQKLDTSCGGAALSMLLKYSMNIDTNEGEVINFVQNKRDFDAVNFQDMREFTKLKGAVGRAEYADFNKMINIINDDKIPFIVRINSVAGDKMVSLDDKYQFHFVVVRGISDDLVSISDPMPIYGGNVQYSKTEFLKMLKLKNGKAEIFFALPKKDSKQNPDEDYIEKAERYPFENKIPRFMRF